MVNNDEGIVMTIIQWNTEVFYIPRSSCARHFIASWLEALCLFFYWHHHVVGSIGKSLENEVLVSFIIILAWKGESVCFIWGTERWEM